MTDRKRYEIYSVKLVIQVISRNLKTETHQQLRNYNKICQPHANDDNDTYTCVSLRVCGCFFETAKLVM